MSDDKKKQVLSLIQLLEARIKEDVNEAWLSVGQLLENLYDETDHFYDEWG